MFLLLIFITSNSSLGLTFGDLIPTISPTLKSFLLNLGVALPTLAVNLVLNSFSSYLT